MTKKVKNKQQTNQLQMNLVIFHLPDQLVED